MKWLSIVILAVVTFRRGISSGPGGMQGRGDEEAVGCDRKDPIKIRAGTSLGSSS